MPQTQSLQLSSKATVQQASVILGQVCVLEGLENLVERPARNTRNAKACWSHWEVCIQKLLWGHREKDREKPLPLSIIAASLLLRLDVQQINRCPVEKCHNNQVSSPRDNSIHSLNNWDQMPKKEDCEINTDLRETVPSARVFPNAGKWDPEPCFNVLPPQVFDSSVTEHPNK